MTDIELIQEIKRIHQEMKKFRVNLAKCANDQEEKNLWDKYCKQKKIINSLKLSYETNNADTESN